MSDRAYRVPVPASVPVELQGAYVTEAVRFAEEQRKQEEAAYKARAEEYERNERFKAEEQARMKKQAEQKVELDREQAAQAFDAELRSAFFGANPGADEATFKRLLPGLRDETQKKLTADRMAEGERQRLASYRM